MKFSTLGFSLLAFAAATEACIRVHTFLRNDPVTGDGMHIDVYEGHDKVCSDGNHKWLASENTKWKIKCGEDDRYEVHLKSSGKKGYVWNHSAGYGADLKVKDSKHDVQCTYRTGLNDRCAGYTSTDEVTLWDEFGDCDAKKYSVKNCGANCDISDKDEK